MTESLDARSSLGPMGLVSRIELNNQLALGLHPDKNGAPGADEAFKSQSIRVDELWSC